MRDYQSPPKCIDKIYMEWYETYKRIGRFKTENGLDIALCFPKPLIYGLDDGDILYLDSKFGIIVEIVPCEVLSIQWGNKLEIAKLCYEIGNAHIPLFVSSLKNEFYIPYEKTLENTLTKLGFLTEKILTKLHPKQRFYVSLPILPEPRFILSPDFKITIKTAH
ncbi:urease accessory protein UreE [Helicobacter didelphidarum]|uniref:Urease accessory protein UreE n=1 Tax=Helicobacter didelphidarum TaxID=2040648 RepID=A0A3D8ILW2_9HELI|nr:urease accessory protein UreE [Helicobacter didelphidarum]RDU66218.1 urease accessory protein UreE [Helicobacter didelphidarum]